jgi:hypothetical protein
MSRRCIGGCESTSHLATDPAEPRPELREAHRMRACLVVLVLVMSGCGSQAAATTTSQPAMLSYDESVSVCERLHREALPCAAEFIDLNIELRMKYSPEFAQAMKDPATRKEVTEIGLQEVSRDAANARERCSEYAKPEWGPPQPRTDLAVFEACYAKPACPDKMACLRPVMEPRFKYRAEHGSPH